jgi:hypothetical protein
MKRAIMQLSTELLTQLLQLPPQVRVLRVTPGGSHDLTIIELILEGEGLPVPEYHAMAPLPEVRGFAPTRQAGMILNALP